MNFPFFLDLESICFLDVMYVAGCSSISPLTVGVCSLQQPLMVKGNTPAHHFVICAPCDLSMQVVYMYMFLYARNKKCGLLNYESVCKGVVNEHLCLSMKLMNESCVDIYLNTTCRNYK